MEAKDIKHLLQHTTIDYRRIGVQHPTYFTLKDGKRGWEKCTLINMNKNHKGIGIRFHTDKEIRINTVVTIDLSSTDECRPACITGIVRWIKKTGNDFEGGMELKSGIDKLERALS